MEYIYRPWDNETKIHIQDPDRHAFGPFEIARCGASIPSPEKSTEIPVGRVMCEKCKETR